MMNKIPNFYIETICVKLKKKIIQPKMSIELRLRNPTLEESTTSETDSVSYVL